jgi:DUF2075 family protein
MIIYKSTTYDFSLDVRYNKIVEKIEDEFVKILGRKPGSSERKALQNSLSKMNEVIINENLTETDCGVLIEYQIPSTSMRIDFMITGKDKFMNLNAVIIELKQWEKVDACNTINEVLTYTGGNYREVLHPAVQVNRYHRYLCDSISTFDEEEIDRIKLYSCSYLHNYKASEINDILFDEKFKPYLDQNPLFIKKDTKKIGEFINSHVCNGDGKEIVEKIERAVVKPSKKLIDHVNEIINAKSEFILMDNQLVVFDRVMQIVEDRKKSQKKSTVIIKGGPGTGKSVIALNLLGHILKIDDECTFLAANAAFKNGMINKIDKDRSKVLFKHPYYFNKYLINNDLSYGTVIIDEAHRISSTPPPMQKKMDKCLIKSIIERTDITVFFVDDDQMIRPKDIGSYEYIKKCAEMQKNDVYTYELEAQFRCAGSEGYLNWLDDVLDIRKSANATGWENTDDIEFEIIDNPNEMRDRIFKLQERGNNSRIVAGYAWPWSKELDANGELQKDVKMYSNNELIFEMPWNPQENYKGRRAKSIPKSGAEWSIDKNGVNQIGCIHTCQGLEFDYVGVIIGEEFKYNLDEGKWEANASKCLDKKISKKDQKDFQRLAKNTYKTLLTRGIKGAFIYSVDKDTMTYLKNRLRILKKVNRIRTFPKKNINLKELLYNDAIPGGLEVATEKTSYKIKKSIKINKFSIRPYKEDYYICDIIDEQSFIRHVEPLLKYESKDINIKLKGLLENDSKIKYYAKAKTGMKIEAGFTEFIPLVYSKSLENGNEKLSVIFEK